MSLQFHYDVVDAHGNKHTGELTAVSHKDALLQLSQKRLIVVDLSEIKVRQDEGHTWKSLKREDLILAMYEVASMLKSGVNIGDAIEAQSLSAAHPKLKSAFKLAVKTLQHGGTFEQAIVAANLALPEYVYQMIKAGELSGQLGIALSDACEQMQYDLDVSNETRNALIYPSILVLSGISAVIMMFVYVVPSFTNLLEHADKLPFLAWAVLSMGKWANQHGILLILILLSPVVVGYFAWKNNATRMKILEFIEKLPVVGDWISQSDVASWSKVLSALIKNRIELTQALDLAQVSVRMPGRKLSLGKAKSAVRAGESLSKALEQYKCLTPTGYNLIRVGEKSGRLDEMLGALATLYTNQGRQRMKKLLILIEPVAILSIGVAIGVIITGIMLAITSANDIPL